MVLLAALALAGALRAAPAVAAGISPPVADCLKNGGLTRNYSLPELEHALHTLNAAVSEYSNCSAVIQQAIQARIGGNLHGGNGKGGGSFLPTWLLVLLIVLVLGGAGFAGVAIRRRQDGD